MLTLNTENTRSKQVKHTKYCHIVSPATHVQELFALSRNKTKAMSRNKTKAMYVRIAIPTSANSPRIVEPHHVCGGSLTFCFQFHEHVRWLVLIGLAWPLTVSQVRNAIQLKTQRKKRKQKGERNTRRKRARYEKQKGRERSNRQDNQERRGR